MDIPAVQVSTSGNSDPDPEEIDRLIEQAKYLLDDERAHVTKLLEARKLKVQISVFIIGVVVLRLAALTDGSGLVDWADILVRSLLFNGLLVLVLGGAIVATEGDPILNAIIKWSTPKPETPHKALSIGGTSGLSGALKQLYPTDSYLDEPNWRDRISQYRAAYADLNVRNQAIRTRMKLGTLLIGIGFFSILIVFGLYAFAPSAKEGMGNDGDKLQHGDTSSAAGSGCATIERGSQCCSESDRTPSIGRGAAHPRAGQQGVVFPHVEVYIGNMMVKNLPDQNTEAARVVKESTAGDKPLPADLEAAWAEWSKSTRGVDERGWALLRAAFEAGAEAGRGSSTAAELRRKGG